MYIHIFISLFIIQTIIIICIIVISIFIIIIIIMIIIMIKGSAPKRGRYSTTVLPPSASVQWQPHGLTIPASRIPKIIIKQCFLKVFIVLFHYIYIYNIKDGE